MVEVGAKLYSMGVLLAAEVFLAEVLLAEVLLAGMLLAGSAPLLLILSPSAVKVHREVYFWTDKTT